MMGIIRIRISRRMERSLWLWALKAKGLKLISRRTNDTKNWQMIRLLPNNLEMNTEVNKKELSV
jgi:hypothetical protein